MKTVSVVICTLSGSPTRDANVQLLLNDFKAQSLPPQEVVIVRDGRPRTKAHNQGAEAASSELIFFADDDIRLGHPDTLKTIVQKFEDESIGIIGVSIVAPQTSTDFQRKAASQLLKAQNMVAHAALAIPKSLYAAVGGEDEALELNDDAQLNYKVRQQGKKIEVLPSEFFVLHPELASTVELIKKYFAQGQSQGRDYKNMPNMIYNTALTSEQNIKKGSIAGQITRNLGILLKSLFNLKWLLLLSRTATGAGFITSYLFTKKTISQTGTVEVITLGTQTADRAL